LWFLQLPVAPLELRISPGKRVGPGWAGRTARRVGADAIAITRRAGSITQ